MALGFEYARPGDKKERTLTHRDLRRTTTNSKGLSHSKYLNIDRPVAACHNGSGRPQWDRNRKDHPVPELKFFDLL